MSGIGNQQVIVSVRGVSEITPIEIIAGKVIPAVTDLQAY